MIAILVGVDRNCPISHINTPSVLRAYLANTIQLKSYRFPVKTSDHIRPYIRCLEREREKERDLSGTHTLMSMFGKIFGHNWSKS